MTMQRAYSVLTLKSVDEERRILTGTASTPETDRQGDIVEPMGAEFKLPIPFLWQHESDQPVGHVTRAKQTKNGIDVEIRLTKWDKPGRLKDRLDEAWETIQAGLVRGLSIGFSPVESAHIDGTYGTRFLKWLWLELSAVTIPANGSASIQTIKSIDRAQLAASGRALGDAGRREEGPGASGTAATAASSGTPTNRSPKGKENEMKTLQQLREEHDTKSARLKELVGIFQADDYEPTDEETDEFDTLDAEVKKLNKDIMVARFTATAASSARQVEGKSTATATRSRAARDNPVNKGEVEDKFPGQSFTRMVIAKSLGLKHGISPGDYAQFRWGKSNPGLVAWIKAAVPGAGTDSGEALSELVGLDNRYTGDFIAFLYGLTVFDKLGLREAPANVAVKGMDGAATGFWVGQSKGIPVTALSASTTDLTPLKVGAITVMSNELMADSSPGAEMLARDALAEALAQRIDQTFLSTTAASAGISPAGILNGVTPISSGGVDAAAFRTDFKGLYRQFITDKNTGGGGLVLVMNPSTAMALSLLTNALGQPEFNGVSSLGGMLINTKVITGDNVDPSDIILIKPGDIWRIGDSGVQVSVSREAMIEQDTAPQGATDTPVAASATLTSMFQEDSTAIKLVRRVNFKKRRANAVQWINNADYDGVSS